MKPTVDIKKPILKLVKSAFSRYTYEILVFVLAMLLLKIMQVMYKIKDFNYLHTVLLFCMGVIIYGFYIKVLNLAQKRVVFTVFVILSVTVLSIKYSVYTEQVLNQLMKYNNDIYESFYHSKDTYFYQFVPFIAVMLPISTAIAIHMFNIGYGNAVLFLSFGCLSLLWYTAELMEARLYVLLYIVVASLSYGYTRYKNIVRLYSKRRIKISTNPNSILIYMLLISSVLGFFTYISAKAFGSKDIFTIAQERREKSKSLEKKSLNNRYDLSLSGYPDSSMKLGGPIDLNHDTIFKVNADRPYYLKGRVKDFYDGYKWLKTEDKYDKISEAQRLYQGQNFREAEVGQISIYPEEFHTSTLFVPSFTFDIALSEGQAARDKTGSFMILGNTEATKPYTALFYRIKPNAEFLMEAYKNNLFLDYEAGNEKVEKLYGNYLQLPSNISERSYSLVKELTKESQTTFERVKVIQEYLINNYKYSLEVSEVPVNKEFVDYFLFEEQKGYCTYFASAATILYRIAGIPSRYVEGFKMDDKRDSYGRYEVKNSMAHAWAEVLINAEEDIWCIVEATPAASRIAATNAEEVNNQVRSSRVQDSKTIGRIHKSVRLDLSFYLKSIAIIILILACLCMITLIVIRVIAKAKLRESVLKSGSVIPLYCYVKRRISILHGYSELPEDDYLWVGKIENIEVKAAVSRMVEAVYDEFYGKKPQLNFDKTGVYNLVENYIKDSQNRLKYYLFKLLL
jgi:hypothetical protein